MPLLNEIRAARGEEGVHDSVLLAFAPDSVTATEAELDHARGSLSGRNRELLDTVGSAVKENCCASRMRWTCTCVPAVRRSNCRPRPTSSVRSPIRWA